MNADVVRAIEEATGIELGAATSQSVSGGCINDSQIVVGESGERLFVKFNRAAQLDMFEAEEAGLVELAAAGAIRTPKPFGAGLAGGRSFLAMEALELSGQGDSEALGRNLAALHRNSAPQFGWRRHNYIGATPQSNTWNDSWGEFFAEHRLGFQFDLAAKNGRDFRGRQQLLDRVSALIDSHKPRPSLLHGDLWGGNASFDRDGQPVIFDPAVYYGDREAEIAFTKMFGGFSDAFYAAYEEAWPLPDGHLEREPIYNLYHVLNHFNLFGGGYASQAQSVIDRFV